MRTTRRSGHTLVEMTVVVTILSVVMSLVARAQAPYSKMVMGLQDRATTSSELHLAVDYLALDLGAAKETERLSSKRLLIRREDEAAQRMGLRAGRSDPGIDYSFKDGMLVRKDLLTKEKFVVAAGLTGFDVKGLAGAKMQLAISDGIAKDDQHTVNLVWRAP